MWFVFPTLSSIDRVEAVLAPSVEGVPLQLKRQMQSHTRTNAAVRSITLPATPIARHVAGVY